MAGNKNSRINLAIITPHELRAKRLSLPCGTKYEMKYERGMDRCGGVAFSVLFSPSNLNRSPFNRKNIYRFAGRKNCPSFGIFHRMTSKIIEPAVGVIPYGFDLAAVLDNSKPKMLRIVKLPARPTRRVQ
jgi:hypothetical protein